MRKLTLTSFSVCVYLSESCCFTTQVPTWWMSSGIDFIVSRLLHTVLLLKNSVSNLWHVIYFKIMSEKRMIFIISIVKLLSFNGKRFLKTTGKSTDYWDSILALPHASNVILDKLLYILVLDVLLSSFASVIETYVLIGMRISWTNISFPIKSRRYKFS